MCERCLLSNFLKRENPKIKSIIGKMVEKTPRVEFRKKSEMYAPNIPSQFLVLSNLCAISELDDKMLMISEN